MQKCQTSRLTIISIGEQPPSAEIASRETKEPAVYWIIAFFIFCVWLLFSNLPGAALFEPDEGRNAEIAREILVLKDWVTPHYDFIPRLDKPILFFDVVALSYKLFGISEWSSRLSSALAALGCLFLTYFLSRTWFGRSVGLWSALILLTSVEFFALSQIVISDMLLTFFLTLALCCFVLGQSRIDRGNGRAHFLLMYAAIGAATATKGPIGFLLPAAVVVFYMLLTRRWVLLRYMELPWGAMLLIAVAVPWYVLVEYRHPGYLHHFIWEENVARFATTEFKRTGPWYYFLAVLSGGFLPWTTLLPLTIRNLWKRQLDSERLFLTLWIVLPLFVFSLSSSKLPHYVLPVYPPLAIMVGATIEPLLRGSSLKTRWFLAFPPAYFFLLSFGVILVFLWPGFLPDRLQVYLHTTFAKIFVLLVMGIVAALIFTLVGIRRHRWRRQGFLYLATSVGFVLFILCAELIVVTVSTQRSSKQLAHKASLFIGEDDQIVLFQGYPSSLPFYLKIQRPIWVVWSGNKRTVLGSDYIAKERPQPAQGYGQVLFTYDQFSEIWNNSKRRIVVFLDSEAVDQLRLLVGVQPRVLLKVGDTFLVENNSVTGSLDERYDDSLVIRHDFELPRLYSVRGKTS